jgi:hypothetical protein
MSAAARTASPTSLRPDGRSDKSEDWYHLRGLGLSCEVNSTLWGFSCLLLVWVITSRVEGVVAGQAVIWCDTLIT